MPLPNDDDLDQQLSEMEAEDRKAGEEEQASGVVDTGQQDNKADDAAAGEDTQAAAAADDRQGKDDTIPLAVALDWKRQNRELHNQMRQMQDQLKALSGAVDTSSKEEVPSLEENPVEFLAYQQRKHQEAMESLKSQLDAASTNSHRQQQQQQIIALEQEFASQHPDYWAATQFLTSKRLQELQGVFGFSEDEAANRLTEETSRFIATQTQNGKSFAQAAYEMAKQQGFKAKANGQDAPAKDDSDSLKDIARKQANARTLAGGGGKAPKEELTAGEAAEMSDEEFDKAFVGEEGTKRLKELFGG